MSKLDMDKVAPDRYGEWLDDGGLEVIDTVDITEEEEMKAFNAWLIGHPDNRPVFKTGKKFSNVDNVREMLGK